MYADRLAWHLHKNPSIQWDILPGAQTLLAKGGKGLVLLGSDRLTVHARGRTWEIPRSVPSEVADAILECIA